MKTNFKSKVFAMMVYCPNYRKFTIHGNIGKLLEKNVHDFMYNMSIHIMNH